MPDQRPRPAIQGLTDADLREQAAFYEEYVPAHPEWLVGDDMLAMYRTEIKRRRGLEDERLARVARAQEESATRRQATA